MSLTVRAGPPDSVRLEARSWSTVWGAEPLLSAPFHWSGLADNRCITALCSQPSLPWLPRYFLRTTLTCCVVITRGTRSLQTPANCSLGSQSPLTHTCEHTHVHPALEPKLPATPGPNWAASSLFRKAGRALPAPRGTVPTDMGFEARGEPCSSPSCSHYIGHLFTPFRPLRVGLGLTHCHPLTASASHTEGP